MSGPVFVWGLLEDETTRSVRDWLRRLRARVEFVSHASIGRTSGRLTTQPRLAYTLCVDERELRLDDMAAAYLRPYDIDDYETFADLRREDPARARANLVHHLVSSWAEYSPALVVNRPSAEGTNHSKPHQSGVIASAGFLVPETLVTNDPRRIARFLAEQGRVIYKSISSVRSIVRELTADRLPPGPIGPALFQRRIQGVNVRVHVVGREAFAVRIDTDTVDYRYGASHLSPFRLPCDVEARCVALTARLGLHVSGLDLMVTPDDEWYCFEVNPNPAFSAFELPDEPSVARAVAELLAQS